MTGDGRDADDLGALMARAQDGDRAAYACLLAAAVPIVRRAVRRNAPWLQACDVEDLAQDVLYALHAARASYEPGRPFLPWLLAITKYRTTDGLRRLGRRGRNEVTTDTVPETFSPPDANLPGEGYGDADALELAFAGLPAGQRTALELTKLRELSLAEAAAVSGMSQGALKVAVHRGIAALRKALVGRD